ncbi:hypothetical protein BDK51DRAFT_28633 [Blyttiomyces helicus]|uniref:Uncharacterized protein n=1 Tax=Blyttiomyces helicus TaxID=388810 RepID=A0A4P9W8B9_9FUNG|nr:hypothetical protein BDK51DRAFT_28633 [Blyttiomyces helicus]|eukprot:RKO87685.1 hypothetical protein BDK51DRAFT_28633 [Blyttiomyces helicus]
MTEGHRTRYTLFRYFKYHHSASQANQNSDEGSEEDNEDEQYKNHYQMHEHSLTQACMPMGSNSGRRRQRGPAEPCGESLENHQASLLIRLHAVHEGGEFGLEGAEEWCLPFLLLLNPPLLLLDLAAGVPMGLKFWKAPTAAACRAMWRAESLVWKALRGGASLSPSSSTLLFFFWTRRPALKESPGARVPFSSVDGVAGIDPSPLWMEVAADEVSVVRGEATTNWGLVMALTSRIDLLLFLLIQIPPRRFTGATRVVALPSLPDPPTPTSPPHPQNRSPPTHTPTLESREFVSGRIHDERGARVRASTCFEKPLVEGVCLLPLFSAVVEEALEDGVDEAEEVRMEVADGAEEEVRLRLLVEKDASGWSPLPAVSGGILGWAKMSKKREWSRPTSKFPVDFQISSKQNGSGEILEIFRYISSSSGNRFRANWKILSNPLVPFSSLLWGLCGKAVQSEDWQKLEKVAEEYQ